MSGPVDPRVSDEATGLPPLDELGDDETLVVLSWATGEGLASNPLAGDIPVAVRYLHLRGLANSDLLAGTIEWAQAHIAIPYDDVAELAGDLVRAEELDPLDRCQAAVAELRRALATVELGYRPGVDVPVALGDLLRHHMEAVERVIAVERQARDR